ncbi:hypothetical protein OAM56_05965 [Alphaproteobacteria bacterium]|nr:hypothetical protein [Alphaproteobacteria bacterium]
MFVKSDAYSQYMLSDMFLNGHGVEKNNNKAFELVKKSADNNFISALIAIVEYYTNGWGTKIDNDLIYESEKKCADQKIRDCIYGMALIYKYGRYNKTKDLDKSLEYINQLVDMKDKDGYFLIGTHLIENADNVSDVRSGLLYCEQADNLCNIDLIHYYLFPKDYVYFSKLHPNIISNKTKALKIIDEIILDVENDNNSPYELDVNITSLQGFFLYPYYTKALNNADLKRLIYQLEVYAENKNSHYKKYISNIASSTLGQYYENEYYISKNSSKSMYFYKLASDRDDYTSSIAFAWYEYLNGNYENAISYNNKVIKNSHDPNLKLYAINNNGVIHTNQYGRGTSFSIDMFKKASKIVEDYNFDIAWPIANLLRTYYLPIYNDKKENANFNDFLMAKAMLDKLTKLNKEFPDTHKEGLSVYSFLIDKFKKKSQKLRRSI